MLDVIEEPQPQPWARLHGLDQLREEQKCGRALSGFTETPPTFPPTFKRYKSGKASKEPACPQHPSAASICSNASTDAAAGASPEGADSEAAGGGKGAGKPSKLGKGLSSGSDKALLKRPSKLTFFKSSTSEGKLLGAGGSVGAAACSKLDEDEEQTPLDDDDDDDDDADGRTPQGLKRDSAEGSFGPETSEAEFKSGKIETAKFNSIECQRARSLGYNPSRIPSWCDRILWRSYPNCFCDQQSYKSAPAVDTSDHTPVAATFSLRALLPADAEEKVGDRHHQHPWA